MIYVTRVFSVSLLATLALVPAFLDSDIALADVPLSRTRLAMTNDHGCFIRADDVVECWGANDTGQATPPSDLQHPTHLVALSNHTCAADQTGVTCWGLFPFSAFAENVTKLAASDYDPTRHSYSVCYIHDGGRVSCSGSLARQVPAGVEDFIDIAMTPMGFACGVSESQGVLCFGNALSSEGRVPPLTHVTAIHATDEMAFCAIDERHVKCWGVFDQRSTVGLPEIQADDLFAVRRYRAEVFCGYGRAVGRLWCASEDRSAPVISELPRVRDLDELLIDGSAACVVSAGRVRCWGDGQVVDSLPPGIRL